ncbi:MAG: hypothetical protein Rubg2KO_31520 [Rubricoccaceae bacterium]
MDLAFSVDWEHIGAFLSLELYPAVPSCIAYMRCSLRFLFALAVIMGSSAQAQIQGIGYRLNPTASYVQFDGDAALSDGLLYGGGVGLSFGEFFELGGSYLTGSSFETDFSSFSGLDGEPALQDALAALPARGVSMQRYGGDLKVNLLTTALVPYVTVGTGLVRLSPDGREATRSIYLLGGAGLQLTLADRYAISVSAENFAYRYNPGPTFFTDADLDATGLTQADFNQVTVHNRALRAAARVYIGGRRPGDLSEMDREFQRQFSGGLSGLSLVVEPTYARVNFNDVFSYRDQAFAGVEAGFDFGPLVGLRGFYHRGIDTGNPTDIEGIQLYGGDIRFRLSEGRGLVPFLSVGGGYLDVLDGYATDDGAEASNALAEDNPFALGGVGVDVLLSPRLRAVAEVRGLLMSAQDETDVSQPEDVYLNTMLRGGISFALGGSAGRRVAVVRQSEVDAERAMMEAEMAELQAARDSVRAELEVLEAQRDRERQASRQREAALLADLDIQLDSARAAGDSLAVLRLEADQEDLRNRMMETEMRVRKQVELDSMRVEVEDMNMEVEAEDMNMEADHMVTIPLPREGELYVRYGPPGGVVIEDQTSTGLASGLTEADLRAAVRDALLDVLADGDSLAVSEAAIMEVEDRVVMRLAERYGVRTSSASTVSAEDLNRMERRLEERLLGEIRALREALAAPTSTDETENE